MWRLLLSLAFLGLSALLVAAPVPAPSGKLAPIPAPDPDAVDYDKPPKGALLRLGSRQMRHPLGIVGDYTADGRTLFTAGPGRVCEWDTESNTLRRVFPLPDAMEVQQAGCSPDGRLVLVKDTSHLHVFDRATKKPLRALDIPNQSLGVFVVSPDGKVVAASTSENHIRQFDLTTGESLDFDVSHPLPPPTPDEIADPTLVFLKRPPSIYSLVWSPDGKTIASCSQGQGVMAWDAVSGEARWSFDTGRAYSKIAFAADGKHLLAPVKTNTTDTLVTLDTATGEKRDELSGFRAPFGLAASADGRVLCNGKSVWDLSAKKQAHTLRPNYWTKGLAVSPDGKRAALAPDGVRVFDLTTGKELFDDSGHAGDVTAVDTTPDGKLAAPAAPDGTARVWDAATGKLLHTFRGHTDGPLSVSLSPDGERLATADLSVARVFDLATGKEVWKAGGQSNLRQVAYSPDGKTLAVAGRSLTVHLYDARTGDPVRQLVGDNSFSNFAFRFAWTPDSTGIVTPVNLMPKPGGKPVGGPGGEGDGKFRVVLWNVATGERARTLGEPAEKCPPIVAISPDGKHVSVGGTTVSLVEVKTGQEKWTAEVPAKYGLAFAGEEHLYADGVRLDTTTGKKDGERKIDAKKLRALVVPAKGKTVLTASADDNTVVVWPR